MSVGASAMMTTEFPDGTDVLPKGTRVEITDDELVPLWGGEDRAYRQLTCTLKSDGKRPGQTLVFEVWDGQIVCVRASFVGDPEHGVPVQQQDMKSLKLDDIGAEIYGWAGIFKPNPDGGWMRALGYSSAQQGRKQVNAIPKTRDLAQLKRAADAYRSAPDSSTKTARVSHIAQELSLSDRQAWRYYKKAIEAGLIDDE
jgi:hypothetical protein